MRRCRSDQAQRPDDAALDSAAGWVGPTEHRCAASSRDAADKNFGEAAIYFAGLIMILDGVAGAVAANTIIKTSIGISGLTAIITWFIWSLLIFVVGVKLFPDRESKVPFKKVLIAVGYAHAPGILRFFAVTPEFMIPVIFLTQFWIFAGLIISTKQILNLKSNLKAFGIIILCFLIIAFLSISFVMSKMNALPISTMT